MKVEGTCRLAAPRDRVFEAIRDPGMLMAVIPGCESIERVALDSYEGSIRLRLPGFVGTYATKVQLQDAVPPERAKLKGQLDGPLGSISGTAQFTLADDAGSTVIDYHGRAIIDGPLARLDSRFAEGLAQTLINQGLRSLELRLAAEPPSAVAGGDVPCTEGQK